MKASHRSNRPLFIVVGLIVLATVFFSSLMLAAAQETDGRINPVEHVGGAAVFCVDANFTPSDQWNEGGIRVLDAHGQELLFASADVIHQADLESGSPVLVGTGANAYGPLELFVLPSTNFQLNGTDEWGKSFEFVWGGCGYTVESPVVPLPTVQPEPTCVPPSGDAVREQAVFDPCAVG